MTQTLKLTGLDELLTIREVARRLRVEDVTVLRWIHRGALAAVPLPRIGKHCSYRVKKSTLDALIEQK
jgi:excisionase family DNA binding protein